MTNHASPAGSKGPGWAGREIGLTLIELLLAIMLMGLVSVVLSQTFAVGTDAYRRGKRALRGLGEDRVAAHTLVDALRSARPAAGKVKLESGTLGSSIHFLRKLRAGLEENGFTVSTRDGSPKIWFHRQWPPGSAVGGAGGVSFPVVRDVTGFGISFVLPADRRTAKWPVSSLTDTPPRHVEFTILHPDGRQYESAVYLRVDPEALTSAADSSSDT